MNEQGSGEKYSLKVAYTHADPKVVSTAGGINGTVIVECVSTRCAVAEEGTCHSFKCAIDWRMMEPNIVTCKHVREIECTEE